MYYYIYSTMLRPKKIYYVKTLRRSGGGRCYHIYYSPICYYRWEHRPYIKWL